MATIKTKRMKSIKEKSNEYAKDYLFSPLPQRAPNVHFEAGANYVLDEIEQLIYKKHVKGNGQQAGSINEVEAPIHASNVMIVDPKTKKRTRIGHTTDTKTGKKIRITKKSNEKID